MVPPVSLQRLLDRLEQQGKSAAKTLYRRPVIEAATLWRTMLSRTRFIGVTGSAGKTTTKELLHAALSTCYRCGKSTDSNNQLYSIARTLVSIGPRTRLCVQELGASEPGAFEPMLALLRPAVGVVTNVGTDHYKSFRTMESVAAEKGKLIRSLPADGIAVLNADDPHVSAMANQTHARVVTYGLQSDAQFRAELVTDAWPQRLTMRIHHGKDIVPVATQLLGPHQAGNVLAAVATACSLGIPLADAVEAVTHYQPLLGRMSVHETRRGVTFIRDDWKAPNWSLPRAIDYMACAQASRKMIVLGTISDYGGTASRVYRRAAAAAMEAADHVLVIGARAHSTVAHLGATRGDRLIAFESVHDAAGWLGDFARSGDLVLLKGSNAADHLARLALSVDGNVACRRPRCGRDIFCDHCRLIGDAS